MNAECLLANDDCGRVPERLLLGYTAPVLRAGEHYAPRQPKQAKRVKAKRQAWGVYAVVVLSWPKVGTGVTLCQNAWLAPSEKEAMKSGIASAKHSSPNNIGFKAQAHRIDEGCLDQWAGKIGKEVIAWKKPKAEMPDSDMTVLLSLDPHAGETVWPGYHDGETWRLAAGDRLKDKDVVAWADMPGGLAR